MELVQEEEGAVLEFDGVFLLFHHRAPRLDLVLDGSQGSEDDL